MSVRRCPGWWAAGRVRQRGSGTALAAAVVLLLLAVAASVLVVAAFLAVADRARGAADLVALSAAAEQSRGGDGCQVARQFAELNGVRLTRCTVGGDSLDFVVSVTIRQPIDLQLPLLPRAVPATSHAGRLGILAP